MKALKITTILTTLSLILFMSVTSIANPFAAHTGDIVKKSVKNQIEVAKCTRVEMASASSATEEFSHLRFDVAKFNKESEITELPLNSTGYLRFDANSYFIGTTSEITELPVMNEFEYLRFDVNNFDNPADLSEMPANEFEYLRFDLNKFVNNTVSEITELPAKV